MKILELRFKNLNSLYGEWVIDFTDPNYVSNGIFALTGPTGVGKSTILDAICLALYGKTPRLNKVNKSENEIMSRLTSHCYAEVLFESQKGLFRCHWEQWKAHKKVTGVLQDHIHEIYDGNTGKPIETKKSLVPGEIEEKTGMDYERFTRSVLLAQGGFDSFLKAGQDEKSKILEQLTGSKIYSEISQKVYERNNIEKKKLELLQAGIAGIVLLDKDQEKEVKDNLEKNSRQEQILNSSLKETNKALSWLNKIEEYEGEIKLAEQEVKKLNERLILFKPQGIKLDLARKASSIEVIYTSLKSLRQQQEKDVCSLTEIENNLPKLKSKVTEQKGILEKAVEKTKTSKQKKETASGLIKRVRSLDQTIYEQHNKIIAQNKSINQTLAQIKEKMKTIDKEQERKTKNDNKLKLVDEYLLNHKADDWLVSNLAGVEHQLSNLDSLKDEFIQANQSLIEQELELAQAKQKKDKLVKEEATLQEKITTISKKLAPKKESLEKLLAGLLLREYRAKREALRDKKNLIDIIKSLEDKRKDLKDGQPCPLCGSTEHPFVEKATPESLEIEIEIQALGDKITQAEQLEEEIKELEEDKAKLQSNLTETEKEKINAENALKNIAEKLVKLKVSIENVKSKISELEKNIVAELKPLELKLSLPLNSQKLLANLKTRLTKWQAKHEEKDKLEKEIADNQSEIKSLQAVISSLTTDEKNKQTELKILVNEEATLKEERNNLFGAKDPDIEEKLLQKAIIQAEKREKEIEDETAKIQKELDAANIRKESLTHVINERKQELRNSETKFLVKIKEKGFSDEKEFLAARLTYEEIQLLSTEEKSLDKSMTEIKARLKDRVDRLKVEKAKEITDKTKEELDALNKKEGQALEEMRNIIVGLNHKLAENAKAKKRIKEEKKIIDAQKRECERWEMLTKLIGSADGKKFRNFAQGLTFELMVKHANKQLQKMNDRYLLVRNNDEPLELNVIDNYQAGEIRSTKNLSGGESFIVSLALALGLSKMASKRVKVDSLFLDEGFGTLDEDSLETALESLSGLHQDGKLIGIISHVSALKDRISTQINIVPLSGGRSSIEGPGCRKKS